MTAPPTPLRTPRRWILAVASVLGVVGVSSLIAACGETRGGEPTAVLPAPPLPERLSETGLYDDAARHVVAEANVPFSPQYPLWSDGATKRRWMRLPEGAFVDASDPDAWVFPVGTRFWKEFAFDRRVETRLIERTEEGWRFAAYRWKDDESDAVLVPEDGARGAHPIAPGVRHDIPSRADCLACHGERKTPILGFSALQLSPDRDPLAPNAERPPDGAVDLASLVARGLVRGLPRDIDPATVRVTSSSPRERAALGWLQANCGTCHASGGPLAGLDLALDLRFGGGAAALETTLGRASRFRPHGSLPGALRLTPGRPEQSVLFQRLSSRDPSTQMPPLGTHLVDEKARDLIEAWIREDLAPEGAERSKAACCTPPRPPPKDTP
jgi:mono/diheme cytochrome c family protein